jgi:hypothetical protein
MWKKTEKIKLSSSHGGGGGGSTASILELEGELAKRELELRRQQDIGGFTRPAAVVATTSTTTRLPRKGGLGDNRTGLFLKNKGVEERSRRDESDRMVPEKNWSVAQRCLERKSIMYERLKRNYGKLFTPRRREGMRLDGDRMF